MGILFISLALSLLIVAIVCVSAFLSVTFSGPGVTSAWQPPPVKGWSLLSWAAKAAEELTVRLVSKPRTKGTARHLLTELYYGMSCAVGKRKQESTYSQHRPECPSGRQQMIGITPPEVLVIASDLRSKMKTVDANSIHQQAAFNASTSLDEADLKCPLLSANSSCTVFSQRPVQCRGWCLASVNADDTVVIDGTAINGRFYAVGRGIEKGLSKGLKAAGLDGNLYELNSALCVAMETLDANEKWAAGEPVFASCTKAYS